MSARRSRENYVSLNILSGFPSAAGGLSVNSCHCARSLGMEDPKRRGRGSFPEVQCITKGCARFSLPLPFIPVRSCGVSLNEIHRDKTPFQSEADDLLGE